MKFHECMLDKRVIRQNLRRGTVPRNDYQKYLSSLPDMSHNVAHDDPAELTSKRAPGMRDDDPESSDEGGGE